MNTAKNIGIGIVVGVLLAGGSFYALQVMQKPAGLASPISNPPQIPVVTSEDETKDQDQPVVPKSDRQVLSLSEANRKLTALLDEDGGKWNSGYVPENFSTEPMMLESGRKLHVPFDQNWGNSKYELDTFDFEEGVYHFGAMQLSLLHGAEREGMAREVASRTLAAALKDPSYTTKNCEGDVTFTPKQVKVGNLDAVQYEGESCEGSWMGYEIQFGNRNLVLSSPTGNGALLLWVLSKM